MSGKPAQPQSGLRARFQQWLFRHGPDQGPVILTQRRIYILPTSTGLGFAGALLAMLLGAVNYNLSLGHALVFLLTGIGMAALFATFRNLLNLHILPGRAAPVFAGDSACFELRLGNPQDEPRRALMLTAKGGHPSVANVAGHGESKVSLTVPTQRRGRLRLPRVRLESRYPLGFFVAWSLLEPPVFCLVYPRPEARPLPPLSSVNQYGNQRGDGGQEDFTGLRPRQPADPLHHVAWKAAAREVGDRPLPIKQFSGGAASELWLDWDVLPVEADPEQRLAILTGWVLAANGAGIPFGLRLPQRTWPPALGDQHCQACLEALALYGETP